MKSNVNQGHNDTCVTAWYRANNYLVTRRIFLSVIVVTSSLLETFVTIFITPLVTRFPLGNWYCDLCDVSLGVLR